MTTLPTLQELNNNILSNLESAFSITLDPAMKAFLTVFTGVLATVMYLCYLAIAALQSNIWIDTCDYPTLIRYGYIILGRYPYQALAGQYIIAFTATAIETFPANTIFQSDDTSLNPGMTFYTATTIITTIGTTYVPVYAYTGGLISRLAVGNTMSLVAPFANILPTGTVTAETLIPIDAELLENYRIKVIEKVQLVPGSWSAVDYRLIGLPVTGVKQIYAYTASGAANEVNVYVEGEVRGTIPSASAGVVSAVQTAIDVDVPLGVHLVNYYSNYSHKVNIIITMGAFPDFTTAQKSLILTAITNFVNSIHPFIAACDAIQSRNDTISAYNLYPIITGAVQGYGFASAAIYIDTVLTPSYTVDLGGIVYIDTVTYA